MKNTLQDILIFHCSEYPEMELQDYIKLIYQNEFGSGHMISNVYDSELFLKSEYEEILKEESRGENSSFIESIGNHLCRVYLNPAKITFNFLPMLNRLFVATANTHKGSMPEFQRKVSFLHEMAATGLLPLKEETVKSYLKEYFSLGCPPMHHSKTYREKYNPHYRVIKMFYAFYFPVFQSIQELENKDKRVIIGIDGRCGSGKSMLADLLSEVFSCNIFHMDDFFLPNSLCTEERLSRPGGNIDYERFMKEVMDPLSKGRDVCFQPFNCITQKFGRPIRKSPKFISVIEGSYSFHPILSDFYDLKIFLTCSKEVQKRRLLNREGEEKLHHFLERWIPMEEYYFSTYNIENNCNLKLDTTDFCG